LEPECSLDQKSTIIIIVKQNSYYNTVKIQYSWK